VVKGHSVNTVDWVPNSPDLNIMENLHKLWKDRVAAHRPSNKKELKRFIKQEFFNFSAAEIENLVKSVPNRLVQIIKARGGHIPY
jgi:aspartate carbamoyltransferase regulatory subunit